MTTLPSITAGSRVALHYTLTLEEGFEADASEAEHPFTFTLGEGSLLPELEHYLLGLRPGARETFTIPPEHGFGHHDPGNIHPLPRAQFGSDVALEPGHILAFAAPSGEELPGTVVAVAEERVSVDFNHPLAGHTLTFAVEVVSVDGVAATGEGAPCG